LVTIFIKDKCRIGTFKIAQAKRIWPIDSIEKEGAVTEAQTAIRASIGQETEASKEEAKGAPAKSKLINLRMYTKLVAPGKASL